MVDKAGGFRSKTRHKLQKRARDRGKVSITKMLQKFSKGDRVLIKQEPAVHKGMPHPKYKSKVGTVVKTQGKCYVVAIKDGGKTKYMISAPVHLVKC